MATLTESVGRKTLTYLDYVGGLTIQLWAALRAIAGVAAYRREPLSVESIGRADAADWGFSTPDGWTHGDV
jgi:hypothetical protein